MRESRTYGSEGGAAQINALSLPLSMDGQDARFSALSSSATLLGGRPRTTRTMKKVDNSSVTASLRSGVGSNVMRIQSTAAKANTIRHSRLTSLLEKGEVEPSVSALGVAWWPRHGGQQAGVGVVGGSRLEKGRACDDRRSARTRPEFMTQKRPKSRRVEVRALIGAEKRGNARGAKGGREANGGSS